VKGARITVFSRLAWAKWRPATADWIRASAASARAAAWAVLLEAASDVCSETSSGFWARMPRSPPLLAGKHVPFDCASSSSARDVESAASAWASWLIVGFPDER